MEDNPKLKIYIISAPLKNVNVDFLILFACVMIYTTEPKCLMTTCLIGHIGCLTDQFLGLSFFVSILQLGYLTAHVLKDVLCYKSHQTFRQRTGLTENTIMICIVQEKSDKYKHVHAQLYQRQISFVWKVFSDPQSLSAKVMLSIEKMSACTYSMFPSNDNHLQSTTTYPAPHQNPSEPV